MSQWWISDLYQSGEIVMLLSWIFWVIFSITLHELAHGWTAIWQGDDTPRLLGRLTMNPFVHMGWYSILAFLLIGIAWGAMPVNPHRFRTRRWGDVMVSAAGPAMNIAIAFVALTAAALWAQYATFEEPVYGNVYEFLTVGGWINLFLAAFNLLPVPPFDGSTILAGFSRQMRELYRHPNAEIAGLAFLMIVFMTGIFGWLWWPVMDLAHEYVWLVQSVLP
jgi:Zn-dependent protease